MPVGSWPGRSQVLQQHTATTALGVRVLLLHQTVVAKCAVFRAHHTGSAPFPYARLLLQPLLLQSTHFLMMLQGTFIWSYLLLLALGINSYP